VVLAGEIAGDIGGAAYKEKSVPENTHATGAPNRREIGTSGKR
jgi:hypothetical protein